VRINTHFVDVGLSVGVTVASGWLLLALAAVILVFRSISFSGQGYQYFHVGESR